MPLSRLGLKLGLGLGIELEVELEIDNELGPPFEVEVDSSEQGDNTVFSSSEQWSFSCRGYVFF